MNRQSKRKMIKKSMHIIFLLLLITSCNRIDNKIYLSTDKVDNISLKSKVLHKGVEIGRVNNIKIHNQEVLIELDSNVKIPLGSKFLTSLSSIGIDSNNISVFFSDNKNFITDKDTIKTSLKMLSIDIENISNLKDLLDKMNIN